MAIVNNIIANGTRLKGELEIDGNLRIEGGFQGSLYVGSRLYISSTGRVISNIHADEAIIGGVVLGNIYAKTKVKILSTGHVKGNIYTNVISADEGSLFEGDCILLREPKAE